MKYKKTLLLKINRKRGLSGFTLIELLIVIAIIGILASIVLVNLSTTRQQAINAQKKATLDSLMKAVTSYYILEGSAPQRKNGGSWCIIGRTYTAGVCLGELIDRGYTDSFPISPDGQPYYYYDYGSYLLVATRLNPPEYGPGKNGYHCSNFDSDKVFCLNYFK